MPLKPGERLGPYEILELIGEGGMGQVYRARDIALERDIALKVLADADDPGHRRRFPDEARLASSLNHPNIVAIYALGEERGIAYVAMELVRGRSLRAVLAEGALPVGRTVHLAMQVADGLVAAHASGIIHRDLKPDNIMVTAEERVKVLDFGLAKRLAGPILAQDSGEEAVTQTRLTEFGTILGTIGYMAPEQAAGRTVGYAADQFAFGAILYEMLSGQRAFRGATAVETLTAILRDQPAPLQTLNAAVTASLAGIVERCLEKDPAERYPSAGDLAAALRDLSEHRGGAATGAATKSTRKATWLTRRRAVWLSGVAAASVASGAAAWKLWPRGSGIRVLAVYPFENAAKDEDAEFLCDGVTRGLIRALTALPALKVKRGPRGRIADPIEAGRRLNADAIVTGSIARRAGRILVSVELLDARTGAVLWSSPAYDRDEADLTRTQDEIVFKILDDGIRMRLSGADRRRLGRHSTNDPEANQLFMRAVYLHRQENEADYLSARELLLKAIERDKNFALAYWALGWNYSLMATDGYARPAEMWPVAQAYARQALLLDDSLPEPHGALGSEALANRWDWTAAKREFEQALRSPETEPWMPYVLLSLALGKYDDAFRVTRKALEVEPLSQIWRVMQADLHLQIQQADSAGKIYEGVIDDFRDDPRAYFGLAEVRSAQQRFDDAIALMRQGYLTAGLDDESIRKTLANTRGADGYRAVQRLGAQLELEQLADRAAASKYVSPLDYARAHARLGHKEEAFRYLDAAFAERSPGLVFLKSDRAWNEVRHDDRFRDALQRIGFP